MAREVGEDARPLRRGCACVFEGGRKQERERGRGKREQVREGASSPSTAAAGRTVTVDEEFAVEKEEKRR